MKNHVHKEAPPGMKHHRNYGKYLYTAFLVFTLIACNVQPVMAATIWDKASEIMKDVYNQIILISTIAAVVTASVALLLMNFSKSGKTVDESRAWLKRIIITWAILNAGTFFVQGKLQVQSSWQKSWQPNLPGGVPLLSLPSFLPLLRLLA